MRTTGLLGALAAAGALFLLPPAHGQIISATGSYDNFDCFNDMGEEAEGFEIDIEDITPSDVTRIFPDNFPVGQPYIRYATPDITKLTTITFPDGHKGVSIIYAASYVGGAWQAAWGSTLEPGTSTPIGNGTPYVRNPTYTTGDSCWTLGLASLYPTSGCDHFGISLLAGIVPGLVTYHWLLPDPAHPGNLVQAGTVASLPPSPVLSPLPNQPAVVNAVAEAPDDGYVAEGQFSTAYWVKTFTSYSPNQANLDLLQKNYVPLKNSPGVHVTVSWSLIQRAPPGETEKAENEDDNVANKNAQVVKRFEYYQYAGAYDPETHEALCAGSGDCLSPMKGELGKFLGAHMNAYDVK